MTRCREPWWQRRLASSVMFPLHDPLPGSRCAPGCMVRVDPSSGYGRRTTQKQSIFASPVLGGQLPCRLSSVRTRPDSPQRLCFLRELNRVNEPYFRLHFLSDITWTTQHLDLLVYLNSLYLPLYLDLPPYFTEPHSSSSNMQATSDTI